LSALTLLLFAVNYDRPLAEAFAKRPGTAIVLDVATGRILGGHNVAQAQTRHAAPGSTVKPFVWQAWNEANAGAPLPKFACRRKLQIGERNLDCSHPAAGFPLSPREAIAYSCNSYFDQLPLPNAAQALARYGFVSAPGIEDSLQRLGESGITTTPLTLARAYRTLALQARDGKLDGNTLAGLKGAVEYGSAQLAALPKTSVAGKTGTTAAPGGRYTHAWFAGWAPADKPEIVTVVFLEQGRGGANAAPIAGAAFQAHFKPKPSGLISVRLYSELNPPSLLVNGKQYTPAQTPAQSKAPLHFENATIQAPGTKPRKLAYPLTLTVQQGQLRALLEMPLEDYVVASLTGESHSTRNTAALQVMAIVARTYAVKNRARHRAQGYDFCDTTHCQDLRLVAAPPRLRQAAEETEGELLWFEGRPAHVYYHQHCGGQTESAAAVWGEPRVPYLVSVKDDACLQRRRAAWSSDLTKSDLAKALGRPQLRTIEVLSRTASGRAKQVAIDGRPATASDFRFALGRVFDWSTIASNWFQLSDRGETIRVEGYGAGHGVGLCQTGAEVRAERGESAAAILSFYFPGTHSGVTAQGVRWNSLHGERADLWTTDPAQDRAVLASADQLTQKAEQLTGEKIVRRTRLKIYPTLTLYRDATGQPGTVAAATRGNVIRLQPATQLRTRGILDSTLLHELVHIALNEKTHPNAPEWLIEGWVAILTNTAQSAEYRHHASRVRELIARQGRDSVLRSLQTGQFD